LYKLLVTNVEIGISKAEGEEVWTVTKASNKSGFKIGEKIAEIEINGDWISAKDASFEQMQKAFSVRGETKYKILDDDDELEEKVCSAGNKDLFFPANSPYRGAKFNPKTDMYALPELEEALKPKPATRITGVKRKFDGAQLGPDGFDAGQHSNTNYQI